MSIENAIKQFSSRTISQWEQYENVRTTDNTECSHCSRRSQEPPDHEKKTILRQLIMQVSNNYGGDDPIFLAKYIEDVIQEWAHDLDTVLTYFRDLSVQRIK